MIKVDPYTTLGEGDSGLVSPGSGIVQDEGRHDIGQADGGSLIISRRPIFRRPIDVHHTPG